MKILLHICCANCAIYPVKILSGEGHSLTGLFFNHNIHPYREYVQRRDTVREYAERTGLQIDYLDEYRLEEFLAATASDPSNRCTYCYRSRLKETARIASEQGFDAFSTSLLYSRYQKHDVIREIGEKCAAEFGIPFLYRDFRPGWNEGIRISKEMGLYRQQYCGCIYSEKDRYHPPRGA